MTVGLAAGGGLGGLVTTGDALAMLVGMLLGAGLAGALAAVRRWPWPWLEAWLTPAVAVREAAAPPSTRRARPWRRSTPAPLPSAPAGIAVEPDRVA
jgi:hypothetical protein